MNRTYSELIRIPTLEERFRYLQLNGMVGDLTFGGHRQLNQQFYRSEEWKRIRRNVIVRDGGYELGLEPYAIPGKTYIHHIQPISVEMLMNSDPLIWDLENLISVSYDMHQAIHYGDAQILSKYKSFERFPGDTCPWRTV